MISEQKINSFIEQWPIPGNWSGYIAITFINREIHWFTSPLSLIYWILDNFGLPREVELSTFLEEIRGFKAGHRLSLTSCGDGLPEVATIIFSDDLLELLKSLGDTIDFEEYELKTGEGKRWGQPTGLKQTREKQKKLSRPGRS